MPFRFCRVTTHANVHGWASDIAFAGLAPTGLDRNKRFGLSSLLTASHWSLASVGGPKAPLIPSSGAFLHPGAEHFLHHVKDH